MDNSLSSIKVLFRHPNTVGEWEPFTGFFEVPSALSKFSDISKLLLPDCIEEVMQLPARYAGPLTKFVYLHCYCHPDNPFAGPEPLWLHFLEPFDTREPEGSFLNLYKVCEEFRLGVSDQVRKTRNRAIHPWDDAGKRNVPPSQKEFAVALQELRQCIHRSKKNYVVPIMDVDCYTCDNEL